MTMTTTDTPRTDEQVQFILRQLAADSAAPLTDGPYYALDVMGMLARDLERDNARLREALEVIESDIGKEMCPVETGEYTNDQTTDLLCHLQNTARAALHT